jgi:site-specific DNA-methyltransferase (adenine-specific)
MKELFFGDGLEHMRNIKSDSIDLILTDPPYEIGYKDNWAANPLPELQNDKVNSIDWGLFFREAYRVLKVKKTLFLHCRTDMVIRLAKFIQESQFKYSYDMVWLKGDMGYGNLGVMGITHELIIVLSKGTPEKAREMTIEGEIKKRVQASYFGKIKKREYYGHPTQKPVGLCMYIILNRTDNNDIVLDPFMGVGSTLVAAKLLNRGYIGCELDKNIYDKALLRLEDNEHLAMYEEMLQKGLVRYNGSVCYMLN